MSLYATLGVNVSINQ